MPDLPDYFRWVEGLYVLASSLRNGAFAARPAVPDEGDVYVATDTEQLLICYAGGVWTEESSLYLPLAGGTMTGAIAMGTNKITGLGDPAAAQDAVTKAALEAYASDLAHAARHQNGGADEVNVGGLSGLLADDQHVLDAEVVAAIEAAVGLTMPEFTQGGDILINGQAFNAGAVSAIINTTGSNMGLDINSTGNQYGARIRLNHTDPTPQLVPSYISSLESLAYDFDNVERRFGYTRVRHTNVGEGTEAAEYVWALMSSGVPDQERMTLSNGGILTPTGLGALTYYGTQTLNGQQFDAGALAAKIVSTGSGEALELYSNNAAWGAFIKFFHTHTTPEVNKGQSIDFYAYDSDDPRALVRWGYFRNVYTNIGDETETAKFAWSLRNLNAEGVKMELYGDGALLVAESIILTPITAPVTDVEGKLYYDSDNNKLKFWNGAAYETITSA